MAQSTKYMPILKAVGKARIMRAEMEERCPDTAETRDYLSAVDSIIHWITCPDDRTCTNITLYVTGGVCALLGLCLGVCGSVYVMTGRVMEATALQPYAAGFAVASFAAFWGVRK